jgi:Family of unknown function (DUF6262)
MARADNTRFLTQATAERHQETLRKASDAIARLDSSGQPVNFSAVAAAAGVSRASLYRDPGIRDLISRIRSAPSRSAATRAAQRATAESLRARLDTARAEITRLRAENTMLREQAARRLGEQRAASHTHPAALGNTDPAAPRTSRQRHVSDAKTPHHQGLAQWT